MQIIKVRPSETVTRIRAPGGESETRDRIMTGRNLEYTFESMLTFPAEAMAGYDVKNAVLRMFCKSIQGCGLPVCVQQPDNCAGIFATGFYEWDVTRFLYNTATNFNVYVRSSNTPDCPKLMAEFEATDAETGPLLILTAKNISNVFDKTEIRLSANFPQYTSWIDGSPIKHYYYFIKNEGSSAVNVCIEISPDKNLLFKEANYQTIDPGEVFYLQPLREGRYFRICFENASPGSPNRLMFWLQGKY